MGVKVREEGGNWPSDFTFCCACRVSIPVQLHAYMPAYTRVVRAGVSIPVQLHAYMPACLPFRFPPPLFDAAKIGTCAAAT